ncbi:MAG: hypothetical protein AMXMBFR61_08490 [Fimbriimonadales bacterium]
MKTCIVTVGTSLLTNRNNPWADRKKDDPLPNTADASAWLRDRADTAAASAETNTLRMLGLEVGDAIAFLYSATPEGRWCAEVLEKHYRDRGFATEAHEVSGLNYKTGDVTDRGLRALVHLIFDLHRRANECGSEVFFCATGGFKAETAYMYLAATLLGCRVCYIHEFYRDLVWLPALPAKLDLSIVRDNEGFFSKASDVVPSRIIQGEGWLQRSPELRTLVEEADDILQLNAAGMLLWELYRGAEGANAVSGEQGRKDYLSETEKHNWTSHNHKLRQLDECDFVVRYEYPVESVAHSRRKGLIRQDFEKRAVFVRAFDGNKSVPLKVITIPMTRDLFSAAARYIGEIFEK